MIRYKQAVGYVIIILLAVTVVMTVTLRGHLGEQTYLVVEGKNFVVHSFFPTAHEAFDLQNSTTGLQDWLPSGEIRPNITQVSGRLQMTALFSGASPQPQAAVIQKHTNVSIMNYPLISIRLFVPHDIRFGVRFWGLATNGTEIPVWYETSPFEHRTGTGWETINIDLRAYSSTSSSTVISSLTRMYLYLENPPLSGVSGERSLIVDRIWSSSVILYDVAPDQGFKEYASLVQGVSQFKDPAWKLERVLVYTDAKATSDSGLTFLAYVSQFKASSEQTSRSYDYALSSGERKSDIIQVNTFQPRFLPLVYLQPGPDLSVVFTATEGSFQALDIASIQLIFAKQGISWNVQPDPGEASLLTALVLAGTIAIPLVTLATIHFRYSDLIVRRRTVITLLLGGLVLRLALAPLAGHAWDMEQWTQTARRYFESGEFTLQTFPTLPAYYFLLLGSYSGYSLLRLAGLPDFILMYLPFRSFESIFIKLPFIISDMISTLAIFLILKARIPAARALWFASLFAFNPMTIFVSAVWGMYDSIMVAFLLIGFWQLQKANNVRSSSWFALSALTKLAGAFSLLLLFTGLLFDKKMRALIFSVAASASIALVLLYFQLGEFFYATFLLRILGAASVVRPLIGGLDNPFANPVQLSVAKLGFQISPHMLYMGFLAFASAAGIIFLGTRSRDPLISMVDATMIAICGYYLFFIPVTAQHYLWIIPLMIISLSIHKSNAADFLPTLFGLIVVGLGVSSTVSFGYFVVGAPYIQFPMLEGSLNHVAVFGLMVIAMISLIFVWFLPKIRDISPRWTLSYTAVFIASVFWLGYLLFPVRGF